MVISHPQQPFLPYLPNQKTLNTNSGSTHNTFQGLPTEFRIKTNIITTVCEPCHNPNYLIPVTWFLQLTKLFSSGRLLQSLCLFLCLICLKGHLLICRAGHRVFFLSEAFSNNTAYNSDCMLLFSATKSCQFPQPRYDYWVCLLLGNEYTYSRHQTLYIISIITKRHEREKWGGAQRIFL